MRDGQSNVIPLRPKRALGRWQVRLLVARTWLLSALEAIGNLVIGCALLAVGLALALARWSLAALLVLMEPFVRMILMVAAFGCFFVTVVFGFMGHEPRFPKWGMLAFSIWLRAALLGVLGRDVADDEGALWQTLI
jgi:predicted permease